MTHLLLMRREWLGQVLPLSVQLQKGCEVTSPDGIIHTAGFHFLSAQDVATLHILGHYVLLSGLPGYHGDTIFTRAVMRHEELHTNQSMILNSHVTLGEWFDGVVGKACLHDVIKPSVAYTDCKLRQRGGERGKEKERGKERERERETERESERQTVRLLVPSVCAACVHMCCTFVGMPM